MNFWQLYQKINEDQTVRPQVNLDDYKALTVNDLYNNGSDPFIYGISRITGKPKLEVRKNLMTWDGPTNPTHYDMLTSQAVDAQGYTVAQHFMPPGKTIKRGDRPFDIGLIGRIGPDPVNQQNGTAIGFYNADHKEYNQLLRQCLSEMRSQNLINDNTVMISPMYPPGFVGNFIKGTQDQASSVDPEKLKLWQQLHLMPPEQKKAAMKQLGVGGGGTPNPWQTAMQGAGVIGPGQKWWAPTSDHKEHPGKTLRE